MTSYLGLSVLPMAILLPVLGIMSATQEWSQRTGLTTFTLEPRRGRVVTAKVVAAALLGLIVIAATVLVFGAFSLLAGVIGDWFRRSPRAQRLLNRAAGLIFLALALKLALAVR